MSFDGMRFGSFAGGVAGWTMQNHGPRMVERIESTMEHLIAPEELPTPYTIADKLVGHCNRVTAAHLLGSWVYYYLPVKEDE